MKSLIFVIVVFIVIVNVFTFIKIRKRRNNTRSINSVEKFHNNFNIEIPNTESDIKIDYIGKEELHKQIQEELHPSKKQPKYEFKF